MKIISKNFNKSFEFFERKLNFNNIKIKNSRIQTKKIFSKNSQTQEESLSRQMKTMQAKVNERKQSHDYLRYFLEQQR